ncbi:MAG: site-specific DNA-methyltransferase, partial [Phototrophicales bacterium]|nr:site-specific DNA-methyltransferase [Phototrophicales bacterium]
TNVLHMATESSNKNHSAVFPLELPTWFIKLFTQAGDVVLDPFLGSGTTAVAAIQQGRQYIGIEMNPDYCQLAEERIAEVGQGQLRLL